MEQDPFRDLQIPMPENYEDRFASPLVSSQKSFDSIRGALGLELEAAQILDDVRFLTTCILSARDAGSLARIQKTAAWLHSKTNKSYESGSPVDELDDEDAAMLTALRLAALFFSWSVTSLSPVVDFPDLTLCETFYASILSVKMARWRQTPGIFLWIMLVACPMGRKLDDSSSTFDVHGGFKGHFLRRKMAVAGMSIALESFDIGIHYLRAFWEVQRWVARRGWPLPHASSSDEPTEAEECSVEP